MKKSFFLVLTFIITHSFAEDILSVFSNNTVKVELSADKKLIRFSYCEDKEKLDECELLGEGQYRVEDLKDFHFNQNIKMVANGLGSVVCLVAGGGSTVLGSVAIGTVGGAPIGIPLAVVGVGLFSWGIHLGGNFFTNGDNSILTNEEILSDQDFYFDYMSDEDKLEKLKKAPDTMKNRNELKEFKAQKAQEYYQIIRNRAETIEAILYRLEVAVKE